MTVFIAGRRLKIGLETREIGDPVPEAKYFRQRNFIAMINTGHLIEVPIAELSEEQLERLALYEKNLEPK